MTKSILPGIAKGASPARPQPSEPSRPSLEWADLPPAVARLRTRILQATASRDIEALRIPIQWSEVSPLFQRNQPLDFDPIAFLKRRSFDGRGEEMLRILDAVLRQPYRRTLKGATETFDWPQFPVAPEMEPLPRETLARWRCTRFADLGLRGVDGGPLVHRVSIGPDGTWHVFWTEPER